MERFNRFSGKVLVLSLAVGLGSVMGGFISASVVTRQERSVFCNHQPTKRTYGDSCKMRHCCSNRFGKFIEHDGTCPPRHRSRLQSCIESEQ